MNEWLYWDALVEKWGSDELDQYIWCKDKSPWGSTCMEAPDHNGRHIDGEGLRWPAPPDVPSYACLSCGTATIVTECADTGEDYYDPEETHTGRGRTIAEKLAEAVLRVDAEYRMKHQRDATGQIVMSVVDAQSLHDTTRLATEPKYRPPRTIMVDGSRGRLWGKPFLVSDKLEQGIAFFAGQRIDVRYMA